MHLSSSFAAGGITNSPSNFCNLKVDTMPNGTTNKRRHGLVFRAETCSKRCTKFEPVINKLKTRDSNSVILIHRDLNTGNDYVQVVQVVEDRINDRKRCKLKRPNAVAFGTELLR